MSKETQVSPKQNAHANWAHKSREINGTPKGAVSFEG